MVLESPHIDMQPVKIRCRKPKVCHRIYTGFNCTCRNDIRQGLRYREKWVDLGCGKGKGQSLLLCVDGFSL